MFLEIVFLLIDWKEALNGEGGSLCSVMRSFCEERQQIKEVSKVTTGYFWSFKRLFDGRFIHIIMNIYKLSISGSPPSHQFKRIKLIECCVTCILTPSSPSLWLLSEVDNNNNNQNHNNNNNNNNNNLHPQAFVSLIVVVVRRGHRRQGGARWFRSRTICRYSCLCCNLSWGKTVNIFPEENFGTKLSISFLRKI